MILFGGEGGPEIGWAARNDVWVLTNADGKTAPPTWIQLTIAGQAPPPRGNHAAAYDPSTNRLMIYGGVESLNGSGGCPCNIYSDTWVLTNANGTGSQPPTWTQLSPSGTIPTLSQTAFAYDPVQNVLIIYGGYDVSGNANTETWTLSNANGLGGTPAWAQLVTVGTPQQSVAASAGYDSSTQRFFLFGGDYFAGATETSTNTAWVLTNATGNVTNTASTWQTLTVSGTAPLPRAGAAGAYDTANNRFLIFGGQELPAIFTFSDSWVLTNPNGVVTTQTSINEVLPNQGGNAGSVTVRILGGGFQIGASASLAGIGPNIVASNVTVENASSLTATFDLTQAAPGIRNLLITNPDGTAASALSAFTVVQGGQPQLSAVLVSTSPIRVGRTGILMPVLTNPGLVDAPIAFSFLKSNGALGASAPLAPIPGLTAVPSQSSIALPPTYINFPSPGCQSSTLYGGLPQAAAYPCDQVATMIDASENAQTAFQGGRLASLLQILLNIRDGSCYALATPGLNQDAYCNNLLAADDALDGMAKGADSATKALCLAADNSGCSFDCGLFGPDVDPFEALANSIRSAIDRWKTQTTALSQLDQLLLNSLIADVQSNTITLPTLACGGCTLPQAVSTSLASTQICAIASADPNGKTGAAGSGASHYVSGQIPIPYTISFANLATATAPAQRVGITDQLDLSRYDLSTLQLGPIVFGSTTIPVAPGSVDFSGLTDLRPGANLLVTIEAHLNTRTGLLTWNLQSIDPSTHLPPTDPTVGFLPPGAEGSVFFLVKPSKGLTTETQITNQATIVFDANAPLPTAPWVNTVDNTAPTSHMASLPTSESALTFPLLWSGTDVGSGIQDFTVYQSDNGGPFTAVLNNVSATSTSFTGLAGHSYAFYSIARDLVGNVESFKVVGEATTQVGVAFGELSAKLEVTTGSNPDFELSGTLTLGGNSNGITPDTQPVTLVVGNFSVTIPAGSFKKNKKGVYAFEGMINAAKLEFRIAPTGGVSFAFNAEVSGVSLVGTNSPLTLQLLVGGNGGTTNVTARVD